MPLTTTSPERPEKKTPSVGAKPYELNLADYWRIILKRKWIVASIFIVIYIGAVIFTNLKKNIYQAVSEVRIVQETTVSAFPSFMFPGFSTDVIATQAMVITSTPVIERVVLRLGLVDEKSSREEIQTVISEIQGTISTKREEQTDLILIQVTHTDPQLAAKIANYTAEEFKTVNLLEKNKKARTLREFVETQLKVSQGRIAGLEKRLGELREKGAATGVAVGLQNQLTNLKLEHVSLLQKFTEKHPDVIKLAEQMAAIQKELKNLPTEETELTGLNRELEVSERTYRFLKDKYENARIAEAEEVGNVTVVNYAAIPGAPISPNRRMNKLVGAFLGVVLGILVGFVVESMDTSIGTIEDIENLVKLPVLGVIPYLLSETKKWNPLKQLQQRFQRLSTPPKQNLLVVYMDPKSTMAEAYRILRTHITFSDQADGLGKAFIFTSTGPQEGKSVTCANLAISFSQSGKKVILIDSDLRRSSVHRLFGLKRVPGLSDVLLGTVKFEDAVKNITDILTGELSWEQMLKGAGLDHLSILTSGTMTPNPAELLTAQRMSSLLERLKAEYDYIIIDSAPILAVTDTMVFAKYVDSVFMVYQMGRTARRALLRARDELDIAGIGVKGIVLNQANPDVKLGSTYYYQYGYSSTEEGPASDIRRPA